MASEPMLLVEKTVQEASATSTAAANATSSTKGTEDNRSLRNFSPPVHSHTLSAKSENKILICDLGAYLCRVGLARAATPQKLRCLARKCENPAGWKVEHLSEVNDNSNSSLALVLPEKKAETTLVLPFVNGVITDWQALEHTWRHAFHYTAGIDSLRNHAVLLTEPPLRSLAQRERTLRLLFETLGAAAVHVATAGVLAAYAAGRPTACVLDCGHSASCVLPLYEGHLIAHAMARVDVAGEALSLFLKRLLTERGVYLDDSTETLLLLDQIKRSVSFVAADVDEAWHAAESVNLELPDGTEITLSSERFRVMEPLFFPRILGAERAGVADSVISAIQACPIDVRRPLYASVVLAGGTTQAKGFPARLAADLKATLCTSDGIDGPRVGVIALDGRADLVWHGGALLAGLLGDDSEQWVTREEFSRDGAEAVLCKCTMLQSATRTLPV